MTRMNTNSITEARRAGIFAAASGKDFQAPCRSSAAVPGCECGWRLAASSSAGRDACATRFTQDYAAPTALGRIELKMPKNSRLGLEMGVFSQAKAHEPNH